MAQPLADVDIALARGLREFTQAMIREAPRLTLSRTAAGTLAALESCGPQGITALAARELISQPAMTGVVQRLESAGLVRRTTDVADRRVSLIELTGDGVRALAERRATHEAFLAEKVARLSPEHRDALRAALPALDSLQARPVP